jgi:FtsP/CotA-like multicopper oxidase with cupredoxin domain
MTARRVSRRQANFADDPGTFVEHCHIVSHEDLGMMSAIQVTRT